MNESTYTQVNGHSMRRSIRYQMGNGSRQSRWGTHTASMSSLIKMERRFLIKVFFLRISSAIRSNENGSESQIELPDFIHLSSMLHTIIRLLNILILRVDRMITKQKQSMIYSIGMFDSFTHRLDRERLK